ncbi:hypothetical protein NDU88_007598 [Pleurodeles waltl]|uniref:SEA domain-containing protein n=1 Tax=Pleurodeles waltl TaxID=8319 RepID=A0AAV7ST76_PLEWA|nr:hypothetical protein NDU88_007598 [Pleurodeles waltl]
MTCTDHWDPDYANTTSSKYLERKKKIFDVIEILLRFFQSLQRLENCHFSQEDSVVTELEVLFYLPSGVPTAEEIAKEIGDYIANSNNTLAGFPVDLNSITVNGKYTNASSG